jgi:hypothetical protein
VSNTAGTTVHGAGAYQPGWYPDPLHRYDHRWYNGSTWTSDVSVNGRRYVDPVTPASSGSSPPAIPGGRLPRGLAIFALICGLAAVATTWMPFVVIIGIVAATVAIGLAVTALRRISRGTADGKGMAITGLVCAVVAIALAPVGIILTQRTTREFVRFIEPAPHQVEVTSCKHNAGIASVAGTLRNDDDTIRSFVVFVDVIDTDDKSTLTSVFVTVSDVPAGTERTWEASSGAPGSQPVTCRISAVTGPFPFGLQLDP